MSRTITLLATAGLLLMLILPLAVARADGRPARADGAPVADVYGDPLPAGAVARAGTVRLRPATGSNVVWSPDGKAVAAGSGSDVRLWDASTGKVARVLRGGDVGESVEVVAISPDGGTLAAAPGQAGIRLFDLPTGKVVREIAAAGAQSLSFSPDGKTLMAVMPMGLFPETARPAFWNVSTGAEVKKPRLGDGTTFLGMAAGWEAALWADRRSRLISLPPAGPGAPPRWIEFERVAGVSADGEVLAVGKGGGFTVELSEVPSGLTLRTLEAPPVPVGPDEATLCGDSGMNLNGIIFSTDRRLLGVETFSNMHLRTIDVWDVGGRKLLCRIDQQQVRARSWSFSPDGRTLATLGHDNAVRLFDTATGKATAAYEGEGTHVRALAFSPDGKKLLTGQGTFVRLWDAATGRHERVLTREVERARSLAFSPDGTRVASVGDSPGGNPDARVLEPATGATVRKLVNVGQPSAVAWSPDGRTVALAGDGLRLFKADADAEPVQLAPAASRCDAVAFSAGGRLLVYEEGGHTLRAWDLGAGKPLREIRLPEGAFACSVAASPDGSLLAAGCSDGSVGLWRTGGKGNGPLLHLRGKAGSDFIASLAFSPDGKLLASAGHAEGLRLWDVITGGAAAEVPGAFAPVAFSGDGARLASCGGDSTAVVWDVARLLARNRDKPPGQPK